MAISYPVTIPSSPTPSSVKWTEINVVGSSIAQYSLVRQVYDWGAGAWQIDVDYDPLDRDEAAPLIAFLSSLRGTYGSFYFGDTLFAAPQGAAGGTPKVKGGSQVGFSLLTDGWPSSTTVLKAGDMLSIENCLYRNLTDALTDGSGNVTLELWPTSRGHGDNAPIVTSAPKGIFRLTDNAVVTQYAGRTALFDVGFSAVEVVS